MNARRFYHKARGMAKGAYLTPWHDKTRAKIMIIGFLANLGYGNLSFTLNYAMATEGLVHSLAFQMARTALLAFLAIPFVFWFLERYRSRWLLMIIQLVGLSLFFVDKSSGLVNALAITVAFSPFMALHNYRFAKNQTRDNRGNEVALNSYIIIFSYSIGLLIGGFALQYGYYYPAVLLGSLSTILGAFFLYYPITSKDNFAKVRSLINYNKPSTRISFFNGLFTVMSDGTMPIWMEVMGISPLGAGINMSLRPMIGMLLTPIAGWLIQKGGIKAGQLGGGAMIAGWLFLAAAQPFPWLLAFGMALLTFGSNFVSPMEVGRWQKRRSAAATMAREVVIASGRFPAYGASILVSFLCPVLYPALGLAFSGLFVLGMRPKRKGLGRRAL
ncbi:MAG: MFS transporter [Bdellovibrionales bacterium]|jgi:hypothetical protein